MSDRAPLAAVLLLLGPVLAQERRLDPDELVIRVKPPELVLKIGASAQLEAQVVDVGGRPVNARVFFFSRDRRSVRVSREGRVTARRPGKFEVVARVALPGRRGPSRVVPVVVPFPKPARIEFKGVPKKLYAGTAVRVSAAVVDAAGVARDDLELAMTLSDTRVASVDEFGHVTGLRPGTAELEARGEGLSAKHSVRVVANPVASVELLASTAQVRTGDVVRFTTRTRDRDGNGVRGVPVHLSFHASPDDDLGNGATGQIEQDGRFVAELPGLYTVVATCGPASARRTIRARPRNVRMRAQLAGHGEVLDVHTSDLWVWQGVDGRDYAVTGTWGADGEAIFWDVTQPAQMERVSTVKVDARTVNDVKVSEDGRLCILSREGASNRKNGIVILDVRDPRRPKILSTFTENLTGGVHNLFIHRKHVFALSAGRRYDVIDIEDPSAPRRVGSYQVFEPGASIHDVWVENGLAYSSNWRYGVHIVDVGNGVAGGTPAKPVKVGSYAYPSGWNHAAFPFRSRSTGKFYVIAGDETFPYGLNIRNKPTYPRGWFHFIDFSDLENPREVARYEVPEAGTHNLWVEGDVLYAAYYNGGLRVVDISGELMGDLYRQGREIAFFLPTHEKGVVPNAPMTWGPQPHKGHIFFSDWNSGLWAVKLVPDRRRRRR